MNELLIDAWRRCARCVGLRRNVLWVWVASIAVLAVAIGLIASLPAMPYNVRELLRPNGAGLSATFLALALGAMAAFPMVAMRAAAARGTASALLSWPLALLGASLASSLLIWVAVPDEAVHDVVGTPVLGWWVPLEPVARLATLLAGAMWFAFGGALVFWPANDNRLRPGALVTVWTCWSLVVLPGQHWVVVESAATDNLTELMSGGGSFGASLAIAAYVMLLGGGGMALVRALRSRRTARACWMAVAAITIPLGWVLLQLGTESMLFKYGRAFSALQFLLSTDRAHYAVGPDLLLRFVVAHSAAVLCCAWACFLTRIGVDLRNGNR